MGRSTIVQIGRLILSATLLVAVFPAQAVNPDYYLVGLGLHQETGRDIYLGGVYLRQGTPRPESFKELTAPRIMEYRVIARRTSIRSLLGSMLLQSEIATGHAPSQATTELANSMLAVVNSSLYAGDSLEILLNSQGDTIVQLNGIELDRIAVAEVANYLFAGWVGNSGASSLFRRQLMSPEADPSLLGRLAALSWDPEREAQVASWLAGPDQLPGAKVETETNEIAAPTANTGQQQNTARAAVTEDTGPEATDEPESMLALASSLNEPLALVDGLEPVLELSRASESPAQFAALLPTTDMLQESAHNNPANTLGVQEYSRRLARFHGAVVAMVYGQIKYPRRAVKRQLQGRLELDLTVDENGELMTVDISSSSGHKLLDSAAVDAARSAFSSGNSADKFATLDPVAIAEFGDGDNRLIIPVPVSFRLE